MDRVDETAKQTHGHMPQPAFLDSFDQSINLDDVERFNHLPLCPDSLSNRKPILLRRERERSFHMQRVEFRAILAAYQKHVAKAFGRHKGAELTGPLQKGVGCYR